MHGVHKCVCVLYVVHGNVCVPMSYLPVQWYVRVLYSTFVICVRM